MDHFFVAPLLNSINMTDVKKFIIVHQNVQSLSNKISNIELFLNEVKCDVFCVTEHWCKEDQIPSINLEGYILVNKYCRHFKNHGGVAIYTRKNIRCRKIDILQRISEETHFECAAMKCDVNKQLKLVILVIYRTPDSDFEIFINKLEDSFKKITSRYNKHEIVLSGDFNIDFLGNSSQLKALQDLLTSYGISTMIYQPTRGRSCLDNICVSTNLKVSCATVVNNHFSDHLAQYINVDYSITKSKQQLITYRNLNDEKNLEEFLTLLRNETWQDIRESSANASEKFDIFASIMRHYFERAFPVKTKLLREQQYERKPWLTRGLIISGKNLKNLYRLSLTGNNELNLYYTQYKKIYNQLLDKAKFMYNSKILKNSNNKSKTAWKIIGTTNNSVNDKKITLNELNHAIEDPEEIANCFLDYFISVPNLLREKFKGTSTVQQNYFKRNDKTFFLKPATEGDITSIIRNLKNSNSQSDDELTTNLVKKCAHLISGPLTYLLNSSIEEGIFPSALKITKTTPIFKSGDDTSAANYRQIALLSPFSKIYEKYVAIEVMNFMMKYDLLSKNQYGFQKGKSTVTAMIKLLNTLYEELDRGNKVLGIFLDLSKAFDLVDHSILLSKMEHYGFRGVVWDWFNSYLQNRVQYVQVNNSKSKKCTTSIGVPQGSVLGPLLYIIYVNDFNSNNYVMYADDTSLLISGSNSKDIVSKSNTEILKSVDWFTANKLVLNEDKTTMVRFSHAAIDHSLLVRTKNGTSLKQENITKFLGLHLSENGTWGNHINEMCKKLSTQCYLLFQIRKTIEKSVLLTLYYGHFHSLMSYGIEAWGISGGAHRVFKLQKRAIRTIVGASRRTSCRETFKELKILTLFSVYIFHLLLYVKENPASFKTLAMGQYKTRNTHTLQFPPHRLSRTEQCPKYMAIKIFNHLPNEHKQLPTNTFKSRLKNILIMKAYYSLEEYFTDDNIY